MSAHIAVSPVEVEIVSWQCDALGYIRCADHMDPIHGGTIYEREPRDVARSAECDDPGLWICEVCRRPLAAWPSRVVTVNALIEHVPCRIF